MLNLRGQVLAMDPRQALILGQRIDTEPAGQNRPARADGIFDPETCFGCYEGAAGFERVGDAAVVSIGGPIIFGASWIDAYFFGVIGTAQVVQAIDNAAASGPKTILLDMHSPGGSHSGIDDMTRAIERAQEKGIRVVAISHVLAASAAYWLASAADELVAIPGSEAGCIGSVIVLDDSSALFKAIGIRRYVVTEQRLKQTGSDGVEVTKEDLDYFGRLVSDASAAFFAAVAANRGLSVDAIRAMDGECFDASRCIANGLVDRVESFDVVLGEAAGTRERAGSPMPTQTNPPVPGEPDEMEDTTNAPAPGDSESITMALIPADLKDVTIAMLEQHAPQIAAQYREAAKEGPATAPQLDAAFPGEPAFCFDCIKGGRTLSQATTAYSATLKDRLAKADEDAKVKDARIADLSKVKGDGQGLPVGGGDRPGAGSGATDYKAKCHEVMARDKCKMPEAMDTARKENPELHAAWAAAGYPAI